MKNREAYVMEAERFAEQAYHYIYGDGADVVTGQALATLAQVYATLAVVRGLEMVKPAIRLR